MAKTCILHIGTGKTGSTTLQRFLRHNAGSLERNGVLVPISVGAAEHVAVPIFAMEDSKRRAVRVRSKLLSDGDITEYRNGFRERFVREVNKSDAHTVLLSSERCWSALDEDMELLRIRDLIGELCDNVRVVVYLRPQHEYAISVYTTLLKNGSTKKYYRRQTRLMDFIVMMNDWRCGPGFLGERMSLFGYSRLRISLTATSAQISCLCSGCCLSRTMSRYGARTRV